MLSECIQHWSTFLQLSSRSSLSANGDRNAAGNNSSQICHISQGCCITLFIVASFKAGTLLTSYQLPDKLN